MSSQSTHPPVSPKTKSRSLLFVVGLAFGTVLEFVFFLFLNDTILLPFFALAAILLGYARRRYILKTNNDAFLVGFAVGIPVSYLIALLLFVFV
jgi:riboflavin transporter FmnP